MRLGIFGGSFDPVHYGHLLLAECCREQANLDRVGFLPAEVPPHKQQRPMTAGERRAEMLELALANHKDFFVCRLELKRGGVSYTVDTLTDLGKSEPKARLYLLMGSDSIVELPTWRDPAGILRQATPLIVRRAGAAETDLAVLSSWIGEERIAEIRVAEVDMPLVEFSSTEIRRRVAEGKSIHFRTPPQVDRYIREHGLYTGATP